ncbi:uncharacterized protein EDB93DRAFT_1141033 [Suillus bovinus]|uniref:uncharacterized protein n=1 Tax=Suillus bovinus TaxID=48563 RepID=UPI001B872C9F|nr:uncharacterized protein EDB93DRAFT_1141033 [Suillus bovinus]KAG2151103.1 hypothetical protein EDB93DRAFT_1141033 [Suillus bovinus]
MDIIQEQITLDVRLLSYYSICAILVPITILICDHMATLTEEIVFIWCRPKSLSSALFLLNRYVALLANIYILIGNFLHASAESCPTFVLSQQALVFLQAFIICLILTLRIYALYGRSKLLLALLVIIIFVFVGGAFVSTVMFGRYPGTVVTILPGGACYTTFTTEKTIVAGLGMTWVVLFLYELLIFVLTVTRIFKIRRLLRLSLTRSRRNIISVMFQDGVMYFGVMTLFNIPNILTYYCGSGTIMGWLSTFTSCISVTLISRLMLNLHKSIDAGILSAPTQDDDNCLPVLTTRLDIQSTNSSHYW